MKNQPKRKEEINFKATKFKWTKAKWKLKIGKQNVWKSEKWWEKESEDESEENNRKTKVAAHNKRGRREKEQWKCGGINSSQLKGRTKYVMKGIKRKMKQPLESINNQQQ